MWNRNFGCWLYFNPNDGVMEWWDRWCANDGMVLEKIFFLYINFGIPTSFI